MTKFREETEKILNRYVPINCVSSKEDYDGLIRLISSRLEDLHERCSKEEE